MTEDFVCLLQDLGRELSVDVIANFIIRNPEVEDLIAAKMGSLLTTSSEPVSQTPAQPSTAQPLQNQGILSQTANLISETLSFAGLSNGSYKMIFVVNMDLGMGRGKQCAQVAHAVLGLYLKIQESNNDENKLKLYQWVSMGEKKIVVKGDNVGHLKKIQEEAQAAGLPTYLVSDAGCTQIAPGSKTVLATFGTNEELDKVTGSLRLL